jgi:hypothetical protein
MKMNKQKALKNIKRLSSRAVDIRLELEVLDSAIKGYQDMANSFKTPLTGRALRLEDIEGEEVYLYNMVQNTYNTYLLEDIRNQGLVDFIDHGRVFHDKKSCETFGELLLLEHALRRAKELSDKEVVNKDMTFSVELDSEGKLFEVCDSPQHHKITFNSLKCLKEFRAWFCDDQITLLIKGE